MHVQVLIENRSKHSELLAQHGLSLYIKTSKHRILFDLGRDGSFLDNAKKMKIDLEAVDLVVISHGHNDHIGGLKAFLEVNQHAKVYLSSEAFKSHMKKTEHGLIDIGGQRPDKEDQLVFLENDTNLDSEVLILTSFAMKEEVIKDDHLFSYTKDGLKKDDFEDEIYLVLKEGDKNVLFTGCSHKGIEAIVKKVEKRMKKPLDGVVGGFHFSHYNPDESDQVDYLKKLGQRFYDSKVKNFVACHCTGEKAFDQLKESMQEKLMDVRVGDGFTF